MKKFAAYGLLLVATTLALPNAVPAPQATQGFKHQDHYPQFCTDKNLRSKKNNKEWDSDYVAIQIGILANAGYTEWVKNADRNKSLLRFLSQYSGASFNWECNDSHCTMGDQASEKCASEARFGERFLYLDSALGVWKYLDSFKKAIADARDFVDAKLPGMFDEFGVADDEGKNIKEVIGMITGSVGMFSAFLPGNAGLGADLGLGLVDMFAGFIADDEPKEKKFDRWAAASDAFSDNVEAITGSINDFINQGFEGELKAVSDDTWDAVEADPLYKVITTGNFAGLDTPQVDIKDRRIKASLAAPFINEMMKQTKTYLIKFDGPQWKDHDLCGSNVFPELQPDHKIGCDDHGSLYLLAHWGHKGTANEKDSFRDVKGIMELDKYGISRSDIIDGVIANYNAGGYGYKPKAKDLFARLGDVKNANDLAIGRINVWNLPFCIIEPSRSGNPNGDLEEYMAISAMGCHDNKDGFGNDWPWGTVQEAG